MSIDRWERLKPFSLLWRSQVEFSRQRKGRSLETAATISSLKDRLRKLLQRLESALKTTNGTTMITKRDGMARTALGLASTIMTIPTSKFKIYMTVSFLNSHERTRSFMVKQEPLALVSIISTFLRSRWSRHPAISMDHHKLQSWTVWSFVSIFVLMICSQCFESEVDFPWVDLLTSLTLLLLLWKSKLPLRVQG